jgi:hypothetical protein
MKRLILILILFYVPPAPAAEITDATGRSVTIPDRVERVLPAGPPASVLLAAIAPGQMLGFPGPISEAGKADLAPEAGSLSTVPRLTGPLDNTAAIQALHPDLIIDYGTVSPRYKQLAPSRRATSNWHRKRSRTPEFQPCCSTAPSIRSRPSRARWVVSCNNRRRRRTLRARRRRSWRCQCQPAPAPACSTRAAQTACWWPLPVPT